MKKYTDEFLISELHRFKREYGRVPRQVDMDVAKNGYPSVQAYKSHFGTYNNVLKIAELKLSKHHPKLDCSETCSYCNKLANEIPGFRQWVYINDERYCEKHGHSGGKGIPDYVKGNLDINSNVGIGRAGEILVAKTLEIANEFDCNRISCGYKIDLYHDEYKKIDVKTSLLSYEYNNWTFGFNAKQDANTYICVGLNLNKNEVKHVWVVPNINEIKNLITFGIYNTFGSLYNRKHWEVDSEPYNNVWKTMSLGKCKIMTDKKKEETEEEKQKFEKFKKEYFKKLGIEE